MRSIIIAYPVKETAQKLRLLIEGEGFYVSHICALGSSVLSIAQELREGVVVCASVLSDMSAGSLAEHLPPDFDVIALSRDGIQEYMGNLISLPLPVNRAEFIDTVAVLVSSRSSFTRRSSDDSEIIHNSKLIIMNNMNLTEAQAHKHLQNESMKTGKRLVDIAKEIVNDFR